jgi:hypothetical protein
VHVSYAHLCDYAMVAHDKLSAIGIFSGLRAIAFPAVHPMTYLAFELELAAAEVGRPASADIRVRDADGGEMLNVQIKLDTQGTAKPGTTPQFRAVVPLMNLRFEKPGRYEFAFFLNGHYDRSLTLDVEQMPQPPVSA